MLHFWTAFPWNKYFSSIKYSIKTLSLQSSIIHLKLQTLKTFSNRTKEFWFASSIPFWNTFPHPVLIGQIIFFDKCPTSFKQNLGFSNFSIPGVQIINELRFNTEFYLRQYWYKIIDNYWQSIGTRDPAVCNRSPAQTHCKQSATDHNQPTKHRCPSAPCTLD